MSVNLKTLRLCQYAVAFVLFGYLLYAIVSHQWHLLVSPWFWIAFTLVELLVNTLVRNARDRYLREARFPSFLKTKLRLAHPGISAKDADLVEHGLRQFFIANAKSKGKFVAMPSQIVDEMWHEFILHTKGYEAWCKQAFGKLLHHTPAAVLSKADAKRNDGLRRAWFWACKEESINPRNPSRLPLLFALDKKLGMPNGFHYLPDCNDIARKSAAGGDAGSVYCGTSFSNDGGSSSDSSTGNYAGDGNNFGGADASSSSDGGGGSDGGCGGGGCGGGD